MAGRYLTSDNYEEVRKRIDNGLDATMLPDATIALDTYSGKAEDDVVARLKTLPDPSTAAGRKVTRSCILRCAGECVPAVRSTFRRATGEFQAEVEKRDWVALQNSLFAAADAEISELEKDASKSDSRADTFLIFGVADGSRGK